MTTANSTAWSGTLRYADGEELPLAADFTLVKIATTSVDADGRSHQVTSWSLKAEQSQDAGECREFQPMELGLLTHMNSRSAQINPVNLEIGLSVKLGQSEAEVKVSLTTHSPWVLDDLPVGKELDLAAMTGEERAQVFADMARNGLVTMMAIKGEAMAADAELPIPIPEASPTDISEAAPTAVPAMNPSDGQEE